MSGDLFVELPLPLADCLACITRTATDHLVVVSERKRPPNSRSVTARNKLLDLYVETPARHLVVNGIETSANTRVFEINGVKLLQLSTF